MSSTAARHFHVFVTGQIESIYYPLGSDSSELFCRYEITAGPDWKLLSGCKTGITQSVLSTNNRHIIINMPIEMTYASTSPYGWPQMIVCVYGKNRWGVETSLGNCRLHLPTIGSKAIKAPIMIPKCIDICSEIIRWFTGKNPELKDPKALSDGSKMRGLSTETYGELHVRLSTITRGINSLGYDCGSSTDT